MSNAKGSRKKAVSVAVASSAAASGLSARQVEKLLASGALEGFTPGSAKKLVERFGPRAIEAVLEWDMEAKRLIGDDRWKKASDELLEKQRKPGSLELLSWLLERGFSGVMAKKTLVWLAHESDLKKEGPAGALKKWEKQPHELAQIPGITFERADRIALEQGVDARGDQRLLACARDALAQACDAAGGGASLELARELARKNAMLNGAMGAAEAAEAAKKALDLAESKGWMKTTIDESGAMAVYAADFYRAEEESAQALLVMAEETGPAKPSNWDQLLEQLQEESGLRLSDEQQAAVETMFKGRLSVVCGKPGAGKTTLLRLAAPLLESGGKKILYAAPTGKAAKRMSQSLKRPASTIHRLLGMIPGEEGDAGLDLSHVDALVLDEASMVDSKMMARILRAIGPKTSLIFVGDPEQLPSVGAGKVLKDLIESKAVPTAMLTQVRRQSEGSAINQVARAIGEGRWVDFTEKNSDCVFLDETDGSRIAERIAKMLLQNAKGKYDPIKDAQVMAPGRKGPAGVEQLNLDLQRLLNPPSATKTEAMIKEGLTLRVGDKVMQQSNDYERVLHWDEGAGHGEPAKGVFNGDVGYVESIKASPMPGEVVVRFEKARVIYDFKEAAQALSLAYACTVHKYQGSEAPLVFMAMHQSTPKPLLNRNMVYTAITRAKEKFIMLGHQGTLAEAIRKDALAPRKTRLKGLLNGSLTVDESASPMALAASERRGFEKLMVSAAEKIQAKALVKDISAEQQELFGAEPIQEPVAKPARKRRAGAL